MLIKEQFIYYKMDSIDIRIPVFNHHYVYLCGVLAGKLKYFFPKPKSFIMKHLLIALCFGFLAGCDNQNDNDTNDTEMMDPAEVHPVEESLTDSTTLVNDSVIVADTSTRDSL